MNLSSQFWEHALGWKHVTSNKLLLLAATLGIGNIYIFEFLGSLSEQNPLLKLHDSCLVDCGSPECSKRVEAGRDRHYYPGKPHKGCAFTMWELTHLLFHVGVGYFYNLPVSLVISVAFELWEHYAKDCGSWLDLVWNFAGALVGVLMASSFANGQQKKVDARYYGGDPQ